VRWPPACEDVSPGVEERPLLGNVMKTLNENTSLCDSDL
jgi:hypothetical protein